MKIHILIATAMLLAAALCSGCKNTSDKALFRAEREGAANCRTVFTIGEQHQFRERQTCFGEEEVTGDYIQKGDTLLFTHLSYHRRGAGAQAYYSFAVIRRNPGNADKKGELLQYRNNDTAASGALWILYDELPR